MVSTWELIVGEIFINVFNNTELNDVVDENVDYLYFLLSFIFSTVLKNAGQNGSIFGYLNCSSTPFEYTIFTPSLTLVTSPIIDASMFFSLNLLNTSSAL